MIRHITFSSLFIEIKKAGCLRPSGLNLLNGTGKNFVAFEKNWQSDAYFKAIFISKLSTPEFTFSPTDLIALLFDEHDLLIKGYQIDEGSDSEKSSHRSQLKSMVLRNELSEKEYEQIGKFVYIKDEILLDYLIDVDIPDKKRLTQLGLI